MIEAKAFGARQAKHRRSMRTALVIGLLATGAALLFSSIANAAEIPPLLPGRVASMAGTHVSCKASESYVTCKKVGGLTAILSVKGVVHVTRDARRLTSATKVTMLRNNDGFNVLGAGGVGVYCHVYVAGKPTMSCALDDPVRARNSYGFDMTDSSVVIFRYDRSGLRRNVKTILQR